MNSHNATKKLKPLNDENIKAGSKEWTDREMTDGELEAVKQMPSIALDLEIAGIAAKRKV
jgi:hypothetical protein|tara:strand:- start:430 stop:609 length:180 start_codon:yes stop_codon:yes gene_type:complete